ncbi:MAG: type II secretion system protein N [Parvularculaceae bacterium]
MTGAAPQKPPSGWRSLAAIGSLSFTVALFLTAPASLAADALTRISPLFSVGGADGVLWRGTLSGVVYNGVLVGDIDYRLAALPLLLGRIDVDAESQNGALLGKARLSLSAGRVALRDVAAEFNLGAIRQYTFFGVRYQGSARLDAERLVLTRSGCAADKARVSTTAFDALSRQVSGGPFPMAGGIDCSSGVMTARLAGEGADGTAEIDLTIRPDFTYAMKVAAEPRRPDVSRALKVFGFEQQGAALSYEAAGVLKGLSS